jgi:hypothetical protein
LGEKLYHKKLPSRVQDPQFEEQLLEMAKQALQELSQARKPITHQAVSSLLGISPWTIVRYPQLKKFLGQFVDYVLQQQIHTEEREQALLEQVRTGVMELEDQQLPVTYRLILTLSEPACFSGDLPLARLKSRCATDILLSLT